VSSPKPKSSLAPLLDQIVIGQNELMAGKLVSAKGGAMAACAWRSEEDENYRCAMDALPGSEFCIFHEPEAKDIAEFTRRLYAQIDEEGPAEKRNPRYDFRGYVFPVGICVGDERKPGEIVLPRLIEASCVLSEAKIKGDIDLRGAEIKGDVNCEYAEVKGSALFEGTKIKGNAQFWYAKIRGDAWFWCTNIHGYANFLGAEIRKDVVFNGARIKEHISFARAKIDGSLSLEGAEIRGNVVFEEAEIRGSVIFRSTKTNGGVNFEGAKIGKDADFCIAEIKGDVVFWYAEIKGRVDFEKAEVIGTTDFNKAEIEGSANFKGTKIGRAADFYETKISGIIDLEDATIGGPIDVAFADAAGLWLGKEKPTIRRWTKSLQERCGLTLRDWHTAPEFWRFAQHLFEKQGDRDRADAAFYFSRLTRFSPWRIPRGNTLGEQVVQFFKRLAAVPPWLADCLFLRWPIAYGASVSRTIITWLFTILSFTIVYATVPGVLKGSDLSTWTLSNWAKALYSSVLIFVTLGTGLINEEHVLSRILIPVQAIFGALLMALTVVVLARKFMR